ncbi:filamentous hemagglutinin N-terminal domain-containing protein [Serratia sp. NPDC078593]|uniref:two-partner secretion domain-containing protein n=1 Tax=unclassified Serratia (in: enterobacteria) TaxID=2647522 RepID=UPI0037CF207F
MIKTKTQLVAKLSPICFFSLVSWGAVAHAAITPAGGPSVSAGANGSTVININAPGQGGVSHNIYTQFDVDKGGVVLNNSNAGSATQLAGNIAGNANLAGGTASIILNEVNSNKASQLNGMIEVAGDKAQVIVANPSGITCSGCGFINTDRATLTTGKAQIANGSLLGYTVNKGTIVIEGNGLNASNADYTDIISQAVQIHADIRAKDLKVTAGSNRVNKDNTQIDALPQLGSKPLVSIDVAKLGGMYANKITLVSTDNGVGVRNSGTINTSVGDISLLSGGYLQNKGIISAKGNVDVNFEQGNNVNSKKNHMVSNLDSGVITSGKNVNIDVGNGSLVNAALISSGNDINVVGTIFDNNHGKIESKGFIDISQKPYSNGYGVTLRNSNGVISSVNGVKIKTAGVSNRDGIITTSLGGVDIDAQGSMNAPGYALDNTNGIIEACCEINLNVNGIENRNGVIQALDNININTKLNSLANDLGVIRSQNDIYIDGFRVNNVGGTIMAANHLDINTGNGVITNAGTLNNPVGAGLFSGKGGTILSSGSLFNSNGLIASKGDVVSNSTGTDNRNGTIQAEGNVTINSITLSNDKGKINSIKDTVVTTKSLNNMYGEITAEGKASLILSSNYQNFGKLSGNEGVYISSTGYVINNGSINSQNGVTTVNSTRFQNNRGGSVNSPAGINLELGMPSSYINFGYINGPVSLSKN